VRRRELVFSPEAVADLNGLFDYIAEHSSVARAIAYLDRIEEYCVGFDLASERGIRRDDIRPGLRVVGFEGRLSIAFHVDDDTITIDRIFYAGRDITHALK